MPPTLIDQSKTAPIDLGTNPRILITRLSAIGDCILTWPLLRLIKETWQGASITWVVDCAAEQLLRRHPLVDEVIRVPKNLLLKPRQLFQTAKLLRSKNFSLAIDPQGLAKSGVLSWLSGAKTRLGFDRCQAREGSSIFYTMRRHPLNQHLVDKHLELLEMCGVELPKSDCNSCFDIDFGWRDDLIDDRCVAEQMAELRVTPNKFVLMNTGAGWESKRWPLERYAVLADQIRECTGMASVIAWGNAREYDFARTVLALAPNSCVLAPNLDLVQLAQWSRRAAVFIGSDTGPMHLAAAVGTPCVALFGTTLPQRCGPYGSQHIAIQKRYDAGSCRYRRGTTNAAMKAIDVEDVFRACMEILCVPSKVTEPKIAHSTRVAA